MEHPGDPSRPAAAARPLRVAVVDDEPAIRTLLRLLFERSEGFDLVVDAAEVRDALPLLAEQRPDVVLLDLLMPGTGGIAALADIQAAAPQAAVLVLSALSGEDEAARAFDAGAFAYLEKSLLGPPLLIEIERLRRLHLEHRAGADVWAGPQAPTRIRR